jgi:hypothetical protein
MLAAKPGEQVSAWPNFLRSLVGGMRTRKAGLEKSLNILVETAADCSELAKAQRASADKQHESAHRMEKLGEELIADAAEIKDELREDAAAAKCAAAKA